MDELLFKLLCLMTLFFIVNTREEYNRPNTVDQDCSSNSVVVEIEKPGKDSNAESDDVTTQTLKSLGLKQVTKNGRWHTFSSDTSDEKTKENIQNELCERDTNLCNEVKVVEVKRNCRLTMGPKVVTVNDAEWANQWHLQTGQSPTMNVKQTWDKGFSGANMLIAVVDDGVEGTHSDLADNYIPAYAYDYINDVADGGHKDASDGHGTNCAGIAAAVKNTDCVIGTAYNANLTSVRILGNRGATAAEHALALTHELSYVDIYSNSWGPSDDGTTFFELFGVHVDAFLSGVTEGRNGLGSIYVWASGNGGWNSDDCNADGFAKTIYTIAIGSVSDAGSFTWYSEKCAAILAGTYGGEDDMKLTTTDVVDTCAVNVFQGTSAATPLASGVIALTLEANPMLTWRDVQHLIVETADSSGLHSNVTTYVNAAGKTFSQYFGFGLMDAEAMVDAAPSWQTVPNYITCTTSLGLVEVSSYHDPISAVHVLDNCQINYLEWVEITVAYIGYYRGDIQFDLTSPEGTTSTIFSRRAFDYANMSHPTIWTFMSVHYWGENPDGDWTLTLTDVSPWEDTDMYLYSIQMMVYGTLTDPLLGQPAAGSFGGACTTSADCASIIDGGCLLDSNICVGCNNNYRIVNSFCVRDGWTNGYCNSTVLCVFEDDNCINNVCILNGVYPSADEDEEEDNTAVIVGAVIGSVAGVALVGGIAFFVYIKFYKVAAVVPA